MGGMEHLIETLRESERQLRSALDGVFHDDAARRSPEPQLLEVLAAAAAVSRLAEAAMIECVGEIAERSDDPAPAARMTARFGCRTVKELVQRATRVSGRTAGDLVAAGRAIAPHVSVSTGQTLPADYPAVREAVAEGAVGIDGAAAIATVLGGAASALSHRVRAEAELAAAARGEGVDDAPPASADELRMQAQVWAMWLDPDGAEPREAAAERKRGVTLGVSRDGLVPLRGHLLPEVAAQLQRVFDSILNPKVDGRGSRAAVRRRRRTRCRCTRRDAARPSHPRA